jgi:hypothetical protein
VMVGLVAGRSPTSLTAQSLALLGYGGIALIGLALSPSVGAVLASLTLMAHAVWDVIHYRRNAVVSRSLAGLAWSLMSSLVWPPWFWYSRVPDRPAPGIAAEVSSN